MGFYIDVVMEMPHACVCGDMSPSWMDWPSNERRTELGGGGGGGRGGIKGKKKEGVSSVLS